MQITADLENGLNALRYPKCIFAHAHKIEIVHIRDGNFEVVKAEPSVKVSVQEIAGLTVVEQPQAMQVARFPGDEMKRLLRVGQICPNKLVA